MIGSLSEWNLWWKNGKIEKDLLGMRRGDVVEKLEELMGFREVKLITGVRRSGKSTLFYQLIGLLLEKGVKAEDILLINFEDDVLSKQSLKDIFDLYQSNVNSETKPYVFLDEIHRCKEWISFLRKLYDLKKLKQIFVTDSSSKFIEPEYSRLITGRNVKLNIFPLSFKEYLDWKNLKLSKVLNREEINKIKKLLFDYLRWGGFPEVFFKLPASKKKLLTEYFSDIIHKDIVERYNVNYSKIKQLADFLVTNSSKIFSVRKYSRTYGLSLESINTYSQYFEDVFLFFFLPKFSYSIREQQISSKKVYVCDTGFFNNVGFKFSGDIGRVYENVVFVELKRRCDEIYYWKNKFECDFLIKEGMKIKEAIQVCYEFNEENREREISGLLEAINQFKLKEGLLITENEEREETVEGKKINYVPLWKWLLRNKVLRL